MGACSSNAAQTCKSEINEVTVGDNFEFATAVAAAFKKEQTDRFRNKMADLLEKKRSEPLIELPESLDRRLESRSLYVSPQGVYDLDAMISATEAEGLALQVTDRYWGLSREKAMLRFDMIRQQIRPEFVTSVINGDDVEDDEGDYSYDDGELSVDYRTGMMALFATRCSDLLKKTFPEDERIHCCLTAPEGQSCSPEKTYQSRPECNQGPLELADTNEETLGEEFLVRLLGLSPPPTPPPSPRPPPPPSPPKPPPPPLPPVACTKAECKEVATNAQREFCDSVLCQHAYFT